MSRGPRQVGKTTLVRDLLRTGRLITLDDSSVLDAIASDPIGQLNALAAELRDAPLIIDEAQRLGSMALALKMIVDANPRPGQFILTGSSNVFTTLEVVDSLAGRLRTLKLWPMTVAEAQLRPPSRILDWTLSKVPELSDLPAPVPASRSDYIDLLLRGGFPGIRNFPARAEAEGICRACARGRGARCCRPLPPSENRCATPADHAIGRAHERAPEPS